MLSCSLRPLLTPQRERLLILMPLSQDLFVPILLLCLYRLLDNTRVHRCSRTWEAGTVSP